MAGDLKCQEPVRVRKPPSPLPQHGAATQVRAKAGAAGTAESHATVAALPAHAQLGKALEPLPLPAQPVRVPVWKRLIDISGTLVLLTLLSPLLLAVAAFIRLTSTGPIFFRQRRFGLEGRPFRIWKFRTMRIDVDQGEHGQHVRELMSSGQSLQKIDVPKGLIPCGQLLRRSAIDELPQLFNVLLGEMSLVGPRPDVIAPDEYQGRQRLRFQTLPGLTGLWQVSGKNKTTFDRMIDLDVEYVRRCSPWLDVKILLLTAPAILVQLVESQVN